MAALGRVLILEDLPEDAELVVRELRQAGYAPDWRRVETEADYLAHLDSTLDLILADYRLPQFDALRALRHLQESGHDIPLIVLTGSINEEAAVECMKQGAADYLLKDRLARLGPAVTRALDERRRRTAQRAVEDRLRLQGAALEAAADAIVISDREGRIVWANPAFSQLTGYTLDEAMGQNPRILKSGRVAPAIYADLWETILAGRVWRGELWNRRKDGSAYLEEMSITPVRSREGLIANFIAVKNDITARRTATDALASRTHQLEAVQSISAEITRELKISRLLDLIHRRAAELVGADSGAIWLWDGEQAVLRTTSWHGLGEWMRGRQIGLGEGAAGAIAERREGLIINDYLTSRYALPAVLEHVTPTAVLGAPLQYRARLLGVIVLDRQGRDQPFIETDLQLLELFAAEAAIAIENARLFAEAERTGREARSLYEVAHRLTTLLDPLDLLQMIALKTTELLGTPHAQVVLWDETSQTLRLGAAYGTEADQAAGQVFRLGEGVNGIVAQTREPLVVNDYQAFPQRVPEMTRLVADMAIPLLYQGRLLGVLNTHTTAPGAVFTPDHVALLTSFATQAAIAIENARLYEAVRRHATELERRVEERTRDLEEARGHAEMASRYKSEFLANMSHELRTPLNSILGFAQVLQEQTSHALSAKQARYLANIYNSGAHLLQLINDILDLSKVEAGKIVLVPEWLNVGETLEDILIIARGLANKKGQGIRLEVASNLPRISADPVRFKQILFNLLSNAVKFTPDQGTITVRAFQQVAENDQEATDGAGPPPAGYPLSALLIEVTDTGAGIKPDDIPRLFQEFVQLESTQAQRHEGTGLGLALTKRLVELHGGRIWAESAGVGRGSTFTVQLPLPGPGGGRHGDGPEPGEGAARLPGDGPGAQN